MQTFVVRVYRSGENTLPDGERLRGVVEEIATGFQATFQDARELLAILGRQQRANVTDAPELPRGGATG